MRERKEGKPVQGEVMWAAGPPTCHNAEFEEAPDDLAELDGQELHNLRLRRRTGSISPSNSRAFPRASAKAALPDRVAR